ncbi:MAG TPA: TetR/AcrR family transcriptional regulator [Solirubrobacteraceae bacterium]|jgi:AcrR family transcriptional regulator|nr:TetR/AcrR family transcriptional regulator [Solirubrobacteraceae bacterium]
MPAGSPPAYTRLNVDERRRQLLDAGAALFAEHAYEEISMRDIAQAAGVSKPLLYHYFPSKIDLFKEAVAEKAAELAHLIEPTSEGTPLEQLTNSLDAYLAWIEANARTWSKLVQSAASLPEARDLIEGFRQRTMDMALARLTNGGAPRPALRTTISGWLGYMDAAILDWTEHRDLPREDLRDLLVAAFVAALLSAQEADPAITLALDG